MHSSIYASALDNNADNVRRHFLNQISNLEKSISKESCIVSIHSRLGIEMGRYLHFFLFTKTIKVQQIQDDLNTVCSKIIDRSDVTIKREHLSDTLIWSFKNILMSSLDFKRIETFLKGQENENRKAEDAKRSSQTISILNSQKASLWAKLMIRQTRTTNESLVVERFQKAILLMKELLKTDLIKDIEILKAFGCTGYGGVLLRCVLGSGSTKSIGLSSHSNIDKAIPQIFFRTETRIEAARFKRKLSWFRISPHLHKKVHGDNVADEMSLFTKSLLNKSFDNRRIFTLASKLRIHPRDADFLNLKMVTAMLESDESMEVIRESGKLPDYIDFVLDDVDTEQINLFAKRSLLLHFCENQIKNPDISFSKEKLPKLMSPIVAHKQMMSFLSEGFYRFLAISLSKGKIVFNDILSFLTPSTEVLNFLNLIYYMTMKAAISLKNPQNYKAKDFEKALNQFFDNSEIGNIISKYKEDAKKEKIDSIYSAIKIRKANNVNSNSATTEEETNNDKSIYEMFKMELPAPEVCYSHLDGDFQNSELMLGHFDTVAVFIDQTRFSLHSLLAACYDLNLDLEYWYLPLFNHVTRNLSSQYFHPLLNSDLRISAIDWMKRYLIVKYEKGLSHQIEGFSSTFSIIFDDVFLNETPSADSLKSLKFFWDCEIIGHDRELRYYILELIAQHRTMYPDSNLHFTILTSIILPSLMIGDHDIRTIAQIWKQLRSLPFRDRFRIYTEWRVQSLNEPKRNLASQRISRQLGFLLAGNKAPTKTGEKLHEKSGNIRPLFSRPARPTNANHNSEDVHQADLKNSLNTLFALNPIVTAEVIIDQSIALGKTFAELLLPHLTCYGKECTKDGLLLNLEETCGHENLYMDVVVWLLTKKIFEFASTDNSSPSDVQLNRKRLDFSSFMAKYLRHAVNADFSIPFSALIRCFRLEIADPKLNVNCYGLATLSAILEECNGYAPTIKIDELNKAQKYSFGCDPILKQTLLMDYDAKVNTKAKGNMCDRERMSDAVIRVLAKDDCFIGTEIVALICTIYQRLLKTPKSERFHKEQMEKVDLCNSVRIELQNFITMFDANSTMRICSRRHENMTKLNCWQRHLGRGYLLTAEKGEIKSTSDSMTEDRGVDYNSLKEDDVFVKKYQTITDIKDESTQFYIDQNGLKRELSNLVVYSPFYYTRQTFLNMIDGRKIEATLDYFVCHGLQVSMSYLRPLLLPLIVYPDPSFYTPENQINQNVINQREANKCLIVDAQFYRKFLPLVDLKAKNIHPLFFATFWRLSLADVLDKDCLAKPYEELSASIFSLTDKNSKIENNDIVLNELQSFESTISYCQEKSSLHAFYNEEFLLKCLSMWRLKSAADIEVVVTEQKLVDEGIKNLKLSHKYQDECLFINGRIPYHWVGLDLRVDDKIGDDVEEVLETMVKLLKLRYRESIAESLFCAHFTRLIVKSEFLPAPILINRLLHDYLKDIMEGKLSLEECARLGLFFRELGSLIINQKIGISPDDIGKADEVFVRGFSDLLECPELEIELEKNNNEMNDDEEEEEAIETIGYASPKPIDVADSANSTPIDLSSPINRSEEVNLDEDEEEEKEERDESIVVTNDIQTVVGIDSPMEIGEIMNKNIDDLHIRRLVNNTTANKWLQQLIVKLNDPRKLQIITHIMRFLSQAAGSWPMTGFYIEKILASISIVKLACEENKQMLKGLKLNCDSLILNLERKKEVIR